MSRFTDKTADWITVSAAIGWKTCLVVLIILIGLVKACVTDDPDPIDHSINTSQRIVNILDVIDSNYNGFTVQYVTAYPVTDERYDEILSRPSINECFLRLKRDAPAHFGGSLLETDIYDFAQYAVTYDPPSDVYIDCIFVTGPDKSAFYAQPNPNLPDGVTWIDVTTKQGLQWLRHDDIYYYKGGEKGLYWYYKCQGVRRHSSTDERFTHFTEEERIR